MPDDKPAALLSRHAAWPADAAQAVGAGLDAFNDAAAPLYEVAPLACVARDAAGTVVGAALGRRWGRCAELQQLWIDPARRGGGLGRALMAGFEDEAARRGCDRVFLDTFDFQAPAFYRALGYRVVFELDAYPHDIVRCTMLKRLRAPPA
jgi:ribosomal protein S18 acetylase RimI-like enzyme